MLCRQIILDDGEAVEIELYRSKRAQNFILRYDERSGKARLGIPSLISEAQAWQFVTERKSWLTEHHRKRKGWIEISAGTVFPYRGVTHILSGDGTTGDRDAGRIRVCLGVAGPADMPRIMIAGSQDYWPGRLRRWLGREAGLDMKYRIHRKAESLRLRPGTITLRDNAGSWGSCSGQGNISLSLRLIMAPGFVRDYVCAHEVAHLVEMNHSPEFWRLATKLSCCAEQARHWLRANGRDLHRYRF